MNKKGLFVVLEGSDGSGKTTQFRLLAERLKAAGHDVDVYDFPRYDQSSSYFVKSYLNGEYGPASEISPFTASLFFALDRFEAAPQIRQSLADGKIVLANRFAGSNMAHQGSKFTNSGEQRGFFVWADSLEFQLLGIPRPTLNLFLRVPAEVSYELIKKKDARSYTAKSHDEHEGNIKHLRRAVSTYDTLCQLFPKDFKVIECSKNRKILPVTEINNKIWEMLQPLLPEPAHRGREVFVNLGERPSKTANNRPESVAPSTAASTSSLEINDISLLAINNCMGATGITLRQSYVWPLTDSKARLHYFIPAQFPPKLAKKYHDTMTQLMVLRSQMAKNLDRAKNINERKIASKARRSLAAVTPMSALGNVILTGTNESIGSFLSQAALSELPELRLMANKLIKNIYSSEFKADTSRPDDPEVIKQIIENVKNVRMIRADHRDDESTRLLEALPKNEFELLFDYLYAHSDLDRDDILLLLDSQTYAQKADALKSALVRSNYAISEKVGYRFSVIDDRIALEQMVETMKPTGLQLQQPTPRFGYKVPEEIEQSGIDQQFIECFDLSLALYSEIQAAGHEKLAGYAALTGHRFRWQLSLSGKVLFEKTQESDVYLARLIKKLRSEAAEVHPLIARTSSQERQKVLPDESRKAKKTPNSAIARDGNNQRKKNP